MENPDPSAGSSPVRATFGRSRLTKLERWAGFGAAAYMAVWVLALWIPHLGQKLPKSSKALAPSDALLIGLVMAALLVWSTLIGRRLLLGITALAVALLGPWSTWQAAATPVMMLAPWLTFKASKAKAELKLAGGEIRPARQRPLATPPAADVHRPPKSARYTPPSPKKPARAERSRLDLTRPPELDRSDADSDDNSKVRFRPRRRSN